MKRAFIATSVLTFGILVGLFVLVVSNSCVAAELNLRFSEKKHDNVKLSWDQSSISQDIFNRYEIQRANGCGGGVTFKTIHQTSTIGDTDFIDHGLTPETEYTYAVLAYQDGQAAPIDSSQECMKTDPKPFNWTGVFVIIIGVVVLILAPRAALQIGGPYGIIIAGSAGTVIIVVGAAMLYFG